MTKIKEIAKKRQVIKAHKETMDGHRAVLEKTEEFKNFQIAEDQMVRLKYDLRSTEAEYKTECIEAYEETGEKDQLGGKVKLFTVLEYDKEKARLWAIEHKHAGLLNLAVRAFERVAKNLTPDFVTISQVPRMTLSKDLSQYLEGSDV